MKCKPVEVPDNTRAVLSSADKHTERLTQLQASDAVRMSKQTKLMIKHLQMQLLATHNSLFFPGHNYHIQQELHNWLPLPQYIELNICLLLYNGQQLYDSHSCPWP